MNIWCGVSGNLSEHEQWRWCRGSKIQNIRNLLKIRNLLLNNSKFILINFFNKSIIFLFCNVLSIHTDTKLPNHKWMEIQKSYEYWDYIILNMFFDFLNFLTTGTTHFDTFIYVHASCHWHYTIYVLVISNLILARNRKIQWENKFLVLCTVLKWRVVVGAKRMVPTAYPARIWSLGTRWTTLTQNGWVLWFTWDSICTSFKNTIC